MFVLLKVFSFFLRLPLCNNIHILTAETTHILEIFNMPVDNDPIKIILW